MIDKNEQLKTLLRKGVTLPDACSALGIQVDAASMAVMASGGNKVSLQDLREEFIPRAFEICKEIAETGERDTDRLKACEIIIRGEGILPDIDVHDISIRLLRMKQAMGETIEIAPLQLVS